MDEEDRRAVYLATGYGAFLNLALWISRDLACERPSDDLHGMLHGEMTRAGASEAQFAHMTLAFVNEFTCASGPNSAGRYVVSLSDRQVLDAMQAHEFDRGFWYREGPPFLGLVTFLFQHAPARLDIVVPVLIRSARLDRRLCELILRQGGRRFEDLIAERWREMADSVSRFFTAQLLLAHHAERFRGEILGFCRETLQRPDHNTGTMILEWIIETFGAEVLDDICTYLQENMDASPWSATQVIEAAVHRLQSESLPAILIVLQARAQPLRRRALEHLMRLDEGSHAKLIEASLRQGMEEAQQPNPQNDSWKPLIEWIRLAGSWQPAQLVEILWPFFEHKSRWVREAAARALGRAGESAVARTVPLLQDPASDRRRWAALLLGSVRTTAALEAMEARLDDETDDDVRDLMLEALDSSRAESGRPITRADIAERVARSASAIKAKLAPWLDESRLPLLHYTDGETLDRQTIRYLLYRQSRAKEARADIEARPLYALIDRAHSGGFALALVQQFAASDAAAPGRWALVVASLLGDDRIVPVIATLLPKWVDATRMMMVEFGIACLALLGTDAALASIDALALRYEAKKKRVATAAASALTEAAERMALTVDELGDRIVPWLGFAPGLPRVFEWDSRRVQVVIDADWKPSLRDLQKNRGIASLGKSAPKEIQAEVKDLAALLKLVIKGQKARVENLMVRQHRWLVPRWRRLFLDHPVLFPFALRLIWGAYDTDGRLQETFRALEDRSLTTVTDDLFEPDRDHSIGVIHPVELNQTARSAWGRHLSDYEITPPFPQLDRPVVRVREDERALTTTNEFASARLTAMVFLGRAEKLGWTRDAGGEGGTTEAYRRVFPGSGLAAYVQVEGMEFGSPLDEEIALGRLWFQHRVARPGGNTDAISSDSSDGRHIRFGDVPPVVFSEAMGDLARISGRQVDDSRDSTDST
jgi:hypothetical protein